MTETEFTARVVNRRVPTGLYVQPGERIEIRSTGVIHFGGPFSYLVPTILSADGDNHRTPADYPAPNLRKNSLVLQVMVTSGRWNFQGGVSTSWQVPPGVHGELSLLPNDAVPADNTQGWDVVLRHITPDATTRPRLSIERIELVQGGQHIDGTVPLVAARPAFARVFCTSGTASALSDPVRATATVTAGGRSWRASPDLRASGPARALPPNLADRNQTAASSNMMLGPLPEGAVRVDVTAVANGMTASRSVATAVVRGPAARLLPTLTTMQWLDTRVPAPPASQVAWILDRFANLVPWSDVSILPMRRSTWSSAWPVDFIGGGEAMLLSYIASSMPSPERTFNLVFARALPGMRSGIALPRVLNPSGTAIVWIDNQGTAVETVCHEIGHVLGLMHVDDGIAGPPFSAHLPVRSDQPFYDPNEGRVLPTGTGETMTYQPETRPTIMHREFIRRGHH